MPHSQRLRDRMISKDAQFSRALRPIAESRNIVMSARAIPVRPARDMLSSPFGSEIGFVLAKNSS